MNQIRLILFMSIALFATILGGKASASEAANRTLIIISDLHIGPGREPSGTWSDYEDFRDHEALAALLENIAGGGTTDLLILGDFLELWQTTNMVCDDRNTDCYPRDCRPENRDLGCSEDEALKRAQKIALDHKEVFDNLKGFLVVEGNRLFLLPGNHDAALLFRQVSDYVISELSVAEDGKTLKIPKFLSTGFWLSADRRVLADHGHFFDKPNSFRGWSATDPPTPFTKDEQGVRRLERTAGEQIVQACVDNLEHRYPLIDNFITDDFIIKQALGTACLHDKGTAASLMKLIWSNLSFNQFVHFLGEDGTPVWDYDEMRKRGTYHADFLVDYLDENRGAVKSFLGEGSFIDLSIFDDASLEILCDYKYAKLAEIKDGHAIELCPRKGDALGGAADRYLNSDPTSPLKEHVANLRNFLADSSPLETSLSLYIFGHTHEANILNDIPIRSNPQEITAINSGTFQRIISPEKWKAVSGNCTSKELQFLNDLKYEDLPRGYTFVRVKPYKSGAEPVAELLTWERHNGAWRERPWQKDISCP